MEQQTSIPAPTPKARMKAREGQKRAIFPSLIWERGGGSRFSIYFVQLIVALVILSLLLEIMLWASNLAYL